MTQLQITNDVAQKFPSLRIGVIVAEAVDIQNREDELEALKKEKVESIRKKHRTAEIAEHPYIRAWRRTYQQFGTDPEEVTPTAENMIRRVLNGENLYTINTAVDAYLLVELEHLLPIGGHDLEQVEGDITLRTSPGGEPFTPLNGGDEETNEGEVVYSDAEKPLTRHWNHIDCESAKLTCETEKLILFTEAATADIPTSEIEAVISDIKEKLSRFCGGSIDTGIVEPGEKPATYRLD